MSRIDDLLRALSKAPPDPGGHAQIDESQTPLLAELIGKPIKEQVAGLKKILDNCAYGGLASGFAMQAMDTVWKMAQEDAAKGQTPLVTRNPE
jgi:hypothetical protein